MKYIGLGQLVRPLGVAASQVALLVADVHQDPVALLRDLLAGARLVGHDRAVVVAVRPQVERVGPAVERGPELCDRERTQGLGAPGDEEHGHVVADRVPVEVADLGDGRKGGLHRAHQAGPRSSVPSRSRRATATCRRCRARWPAWAGSRRGGARASGGRSSWPCGPCGSWSRATRRSRGRPRSALGWRGPAAPSRSRAR